MTTSYHLAHLISELVAVHKHEVLSMSIVMRQDGAWEFVIVTKPPDPDDEEVFLLVSMN